MEIRYECFHCHDCPTEEEWNENRHYSDLKLPEGLEGGVFDCPSCENVVCGEDLRDV